MYIYNLLVHVRLHRLSDCALDVTGPEGQQDVPRYDGFERDVINAIHDDYFSQLPEPLCTFGMYDAFTNVMGEC